MKIINFMIISILFQMVAHCDDSYKKAMLYFNGTIGGKTITKIQPRCPYERCDGKKTYTYLKKDKKTAYKILKQIYKDDERAAFKAINILLKQIDYKSKIYDDYLVKKLYKNFNLTVETYNKDMMLYLDNLKDSKNKTYSCKANFLLYRTFENGLFDNRRDKSLSYKYKKITRSICDKNSYEYIMAK